jgi:hypothetical protein
MPGTFGAALLLDASTWSALEAWQENSKFKKKKWLQKSRK